MKPRLATLIILLCLVIASCSAGGDITPPPDYQSSTSESDIALATPTSQAIMTNEAATATPDAALTIPQSNPTPTEGTGSEGVPLGNISGDIVNGSGGSIPEGQKVTLIGFSMDQSGSYQIMLEVEAAVNPDGSYLFTGVEVPQERAFLVVTSVEDIQYQSDPVIVSSGTTDYSIPIVVYDKTENFEQLSFSQVHLIFDQPSQEEIQVTELFIVKNPGSQAVFVPSDGNSIPFIVVPENAGSVKFQLSQGSSQLQNATGGFAMVPGAEEQYGFVAGYSLPYQRKLKFDQSFSLPVDSLTVFIPDGMGLRGEQLTEAGTQDIQGQSYQMYQASNMASGSSLLLTLSSKPGISNVFPLDRETLILVGISAVGLLLIGVAIYLYLRDRARFRKELESDNQEVGEDIPWNDRDSILDALIALDDQYKAGEIPKPAYETRRRELKKRLKQTL